MIIQPNPVAVSHTISVDDCLFCLFVCVVIVVSGVVVVYVVQYHQDIDILKKYTF